MFLLSFRRLLRFFLLFLLAGSFLLDNSSGSRLEYLGTKIDLPLPEEAVLADYTDDHGGFLGDGLLFAEVDCSGCPLTVTLAEEPHWNPLPASEPIRRLMWDEEQSYYFLSDWDGHPYFPEVTEGYWYFYDRHSEAADPYDPSDVWERVSFNFTLAVYDTQTDRLYICRFDT